jgi:ketosteroid isomerase-like protein
MTNISLLLRRLTDANAALINGEFQRYADLIPHSDDYTLMAPFGGAPTRGFDTSSTRMAAQARFFRSGTSELALVQAYSSGDLAVLVTIEHQACEVGGLPRQDWSLRVTQVFRKSEADWELVHRHADPLVKGISLEQAAAIARGDQLVDGYDSNGTIRG